MTEAVNRQQQLMPLVDVIYEGRWFVCVKVQRPLEGFTDVHEIIPKKTGGIAAHLAWHAPWRTYVMLPTADTIWDQSCLAEIATILAQLGQGRRRR